MILAFFLSMPNVGSWNGRWSGEDKLYAVTRHVSDAKKNAAKYEAILAKGSFYHAWPDGWGASVKVKKVTAQEAAQIRRKSKGFCGYEWMVQNILDDGTIHLYGHKPQPEPAHDPA